MDLSTTYLGLELPHPLMPGASPMADDLDLVRRLEDAGAAAIVMHSLFEEQIALERQGTRSPAHAESYAEAIDFVPPAKAFALPPDEYLEQIRRIREAVDVPVIASLNGSTPAGWAKYARLIEEAGATALELNLYFLPASPLISGHEIERRLLDAARRVKQAVSIPIAVKLSPFFSSLPHVAHELDGAGVDGLVIFNRFYQPDIDLETLEVRPELRLSDPSELLMRLRWLALLSGHVRASLAVSGGVHGAADAIKAIMAGAHAVQIVSALLQHGPERLAVIRDEIARWMMDREYESVAQMCGSMNLTRCPDPGAFERANYLRVLQSWAPSKRSPTGDPGRHGG